MKRAAWIIAYVLAGAGWAGASLAQMPHVQGSADALTVVTPPATAPATPAGNAALPAGHPALAGTMPAYHTEGMQTISSGALRVVFSAGTKGEAEPAKLHDAVTVELFAKGNVLKTYQGTVGADGAMELHGLPLEVPFQPVITVHHGGADEQLIGPAMHKYQPAVELDLKVYELTGEKPAWTIGLRDVTLEAVSENGETALKVTEMLGGYNPGERAWTGENGVTLTAELPVDAREILLGPGLAEAGAIISGHTITRGKTMLPGSTQYVFGYTVPVTHGEATLTFKTPADTTLFALYMPGGFEAAAMTGLTAEAQPEPGRQLLKARKVKSGDVLAVNLTHIAVAPPPATQPSINDLPNGIHLPAKTESHK